MERSQACGVPAAFNATHDTVSQYATPSRPVDPLVGTR